MLENTDSLLPVVLDTEPDVVCVGFEKDSLDELSRLLATLGVKPAARIMVSSKRVNPATFIGKGKIEEIRALLAGGQFGVVEPV